MSRDPVTWFPRHRRRLAALTLVLLSLLMTLGGLPADGATGPIRPDSLARKDSLRASDSLRVDSLRADSTWVGSTDSLSYAADSASYQVQQERIRLNGNASVIYQTATIQADSIGVDMKRNQAITHGQTWLHDRDYVLIGNDIDYDFKSRTGIVALGATKFDKGYYYGKEIRKVDADVYDIDDGDFTTCDALEPHFYIYSKEMRIYRDDKVVAKPLVFFVNHFPVMALPYGTFSIKRGRESGLLMPSPGYNKVDGKFIQNLAYFQTFGDYADATLGFDYMEKTGWNANLEGEYTQRYRLNGNWKARLERKVYSANRSSYEWYLRSTHHQDIGYASKFDANLELLSSKTIWASSTDTNERLSESVTSRIAYQNPLFGKTLYTNASYTDDLVNKTRAITLPSISWSYSSKPLYELVLGDSAAARAKNRDFWWKGTSFSYSFVGIHTGTSTDASSDLAHVLYASEKDSTGNFTAEHHFGIKHTGSLRYSNKFMGWLNLSQSMTGDEAWYDRDKSDKKWQRGADWSTTSTASFSLYGIRRMSGFITGVRHIVTPSLSFTYRPSFDRNDRFYSFGGVSLQSGDESETMSLGLDQAWQLKLTPTKDGTERKLDDFLKLTSRTYYNFKADEDKRFSPISHSVTINPGSYDLKLCNLSFTESGSLSEDAYNFNLTSWTMTSTLNLHGEAKYQNYFPETPNQFQSNRFFTDTDSTETTSPKTISGLEKNKLGSNEWSFYLTHSYSQSRGYSDYTHTLTGTLSMKLTTNWQLSYDNTYDLREQAMISQSLKLTRDLHCWKLTFDWYKSGDYWSYHLNLFAVKLPDSLIFKTSDHKH